MVIDCNVGTKPYQSNLIYIGVGPNVITSARGSAQKSQYLGIPQWAYQTVSAAMTLLLAN